VSKAGAAVTSGRLFNRVLRAYFDRKYRLHARGSILRLPMAATRCGPPPRCALCRAVRPQHKSRLSRPTRSSLPLHRKEIHAQ
jgi:hypothetical protein